MRKRITVSLLLMAALIAAPACESIMGNYIVDWAPVNLYITATDAAGNSIISPDMPGMTLTFQGKTYPVRNWDDRRKEAIPTKAYLAVLDGLFAQPYATSGERLYRLWFGEIDGALDMDEDILLKWPDGSEDTIHYHCSDHREGRTPKCNRSWKLNGKKHSGNAFHFVK